VSPVNAFAMEVMGTCCAAVMMNFLERLMELLKAVLN